MSERQMSGAEMVLAAVGAAVVLLVGLYLSTRNAARAERADDAPGAEKAHGVQK